MFGATALLTFATILGLLAGFAREWLLVKAWGASTISDAVLVAMFIPEALRSMLAAGLLSSASLSLWQGCPESLRGAWLAGQVKYWFIVSMFLTLLLALLAPIWVGIIGLGLSPLGRDIAITTLHILAFAIPGLLIQAVLTVPMQANGYYILSGLSSLFFNFPAVSYLYLMGEGSSPSGLAFAFVIGSMLTAAILLPHAIKIGWRPWLQTKSEPQLWNKLLPLLLSSASSQGIALLERVAASLLGEGIITIVNLARKMVNLPLVALMSLNQVLLSMMSKAISNKRLMMLRNGMNICTIITLPTAIGLIGASPALVSIFLPKGLAATALPGLIAWSAASIFYGSWNALLARYSYAGGDTKTPLASELCGGAAQVMGLFLLPKIMGIDGIAASGLAGVIVTGGLLLYQLKLGISRRFILQGLMGCLMFILAAEAIFKLRQYGDWAQISIASVIACITFIATMIIFKPWQFKQATSVV